MQPEKPYEFTDAVFYFFKVLSRRPGKTLWVGFWNAVLYLVFAGFFVWALLPFYLGIFDLALTGEEPDTGQILSMMSSMAWIGLLTTIGSIVVALMAQGAWLRLLARDEVAGGIPLRFGSDEFRLLGVNILLIVIIFGTYLAGAILVGVAIAIGAAADGGAATILAALLGVAAFLAAIGVLIFLSIRLSAAAALTVLDRKIRISGAWPVTKGIFWWVFLTYLVLALIIAFASSTISSFVQLMFLPMLVPMFTELGQMSGNADPDMVFELFVSTFTSPGVIALFVVAVIISVVGQIFYEGMWHSVGAYLARRHRDLEGTPSEPAVPAAPTPPPAPVAPAANTGDAGGDSGSSPN